MMENYIPYIQIANTLIGLSILACFMLVKSKNTWIPKGRWQNGGIWTFAGMLAYSIVVGVIYSMNYSIENSLKHPLIVLLIVGSFLILTLLFRKSILALMFWCERMSFKFKEIDGWKSRQYSAMQVFLFLSLARLPYLAIYFPGNIDSDCGGSISAFFSCFTPYVDVLGYHPIRNHIPIIHTILYGGATYLGDCIGSQNIGIFMLILLQCLLINWMISKIVSRLYGMIINNRIVNIVIAIYAFLPVFSLWSIELAKDQLYACFLMFYVIQLWDVVKTQGNSIISWKGLLTHAVVVFFVCIMKNQGIYIVAACGLMTLIAYIQIKIRICFAYLISIGVYIFLYKGVLFEQLEVLPVGKQEAMGFMYQQTARVAKYHPYEFTEEEKNVIDKVIPFEILSKQYDPEIQDCVKFCCRECQGESVAPQSYDEYKRIWMRMGWRYPITYLEALQNECYGFFYPFQIYPRMFHHSKDPLAICTNHPDVFSYHQLDMTFLLQRGIKYVLPVLSAIPIVGIVMGFPIHTWLILFSTFLLLIVGKWRECLVWMPVLLSIGILLVSPANDVYRYIEPVVFAAPGAIVYAIVYFRKSMIINKI